MSSIFPGSPFSRKWIIKLSPLTLGYLAVSILSHIEWCFVVVTLSGPPTPFPPTPDNPHLIHRYWWCCLCLCFIMFYFLLVMQGKSRPPSVTSPLPVLWLTQAGLTTPRQAWHQTVTTNVLPGTILKPRVRGVFILCSPRLVVVVDAAG